jgi:hypothetical protein
MAAILIRARRARRKDQAAAASQSPDQERTSSSPAGDTPAPARDGCQIHPRRPTGPESERSMKTNTVSTHRLHGLSPASAAFAAFAANAWGAIPASRGSPPVHNRAGPALPAARPGHRPAVAGGEGGRP